MTTNPSTRPRVRATASKERLFEASMHLLGSRSPDAVSVDEIAAAAGVSKGTVYYNFGSKEELVSQILSFGAQKLLDELSSAAKDADAYVALKRMCEVAMDFVATYPSFAQLWLQNQLWAQQDEPGQFLSLHAQITDLIIQVFDRLVVLDEAEKLPLAAALFGAAMFTSRLRTAGRTALGRDQTVLAVMSAVDGMLATHRRVGSASS